MEDNLRENTSSGNARRAKFGGIKQKVSSSEVISNTQKQDQIVKHYADHAAKKKAAGDEAHAAATKAGKSPMEAEGARNRAHREYEKAQKKARLNNSYIPSFGEYIEEGEAWQNKEGKNKNGGLNEKGRKSYEAANPGSDLKAPSKEVGNPRRASFCARMSGMKKKLTSKKTARDPDSRINKSLRAWNC